MTVEIDRSQFGRGRPLPALVLVDPRAYHLVGAAGSLRTEAAGVLARCRNALISARSVGMQVMFVRNRQADCDAPAELGGRWIKGFEPARDDSVFERDSESCYDGPYFGEVVEAAGRNIVVAGFLGAGGALSTALDAMCAGHAITFLHDAVIDGPSAQLLDFAANGTLTALERFDIRAMSANSWTALLQSPVWPAAARGLASH